MNNNTSSRVDVSIIVVTYNSSEDIVNCLQGAITHTSGIKIEIVLLDNCSKDDTVGIVQNHFQQIRILRPKENLGFARGVNEAVRQAEGEYILLLNPDTVIYNNAIGNIFKFARERPQYGLFGGRTLKPDGSLQPVSCLGLPTLWSMAMFAFGLNALFKNNTIFDPESLGNWERDTEREVGSIVGCFLLCRKDLWENLGGFDESFYMYGEDVDLAIRAHNMGYPSVICPESELIHEFGKSSDTPVHKLSMLYRGKITLAKKHWKGIHQKLAILFLRQGIFLRALPSILLKGLKSARPASRYHLLWQQRTTWKFGYELKSNSESVFEDSRAAESA